MSIQLVMQIASEQGRGLQTRAAAGAARAVMIKFQWAWWYASRWRRPSLTSTSSHSSSKGLAHSRRIQVLMRGARRQSPWKQLAEGLFVMRVQIDGAAVMDGAAAAAAAAAEARAAAVAVSNLPTKKL
ncbi:hypothetical protein JYU34_007852 [Plutella xylostella]|uniref:Uncharacterized protein n=1 Tax=Plutella xylostella TaxID=51655 RepID=A0ABQ7QRH0_PLUXY|nr:hypothetical protein JYU34_007852 [Plutella xylostella]